MTEAKDKNLQALAPFIESHVINPERTRNLALSGVAMLAVAVHLTPQFDWVAADTQPQQQLLHLYIENGVAFPVDMFNDANESVLAEAMAIARELKTYLRLDPNARSTSNIQFAELASRVTDVVQSVTMRWGRRDFTGELTVANRLHSVGKDLYDGAVQR